MGKEGVGLGIDGATGAGLSVTGKVVVVLGSIVFSMSSGRPSLADEAGSSSVTRGSAPIKAMPDISADGVYCHQSQNNQISR